MKIKTPQDIRKRRHYRVRNKIAGTALRPRMSIFRSNAHMYVQFIDDEAAQTLVSASTQTADFKGDKLSVDTAKKLGKVAAEQARIKGIEEVVFDRGGFAYAGKIKALAESARENGLKF